MCVFRAQVSHPRLRLRRLATRSSPYSLNPSSSVLAHQAPTQWMAQQSKYVVQHSARARQHIFALIPPPRPSTSLISFLISLSNLAFLPPTMFPQPRTTSVSQDFIHGQVLCLTLSSSGRHIAIATSQSVITIFSAGTGMPVHTLRLKCFVYGIHLSWNGDSELVAACSDGRLLFFYLSREVR